MSDFCLLEPSHNLKKPPATTHSAVAQNFINLMLILGFVSLVCFISKGTVSDSLAAEKLEIELEAYKAPEKVIELSLQKKAELEAYKAPEKEIELSLQKKAAQSEVKYLENQKVKYNSGLALLAGHPLKTKQNSDCQVKSLP